MLVGIYARKSNEQRGVAADQLSVTRQIEHATSYAEKNGWTVLTKHIYIDDGVSGADFSDKREGLLHLLNDVRQKSGTPFDALILSEISRLGRDQIQTLNVQYDICK